MLIVPAGAKDPPQSFDDLQNGERVQTIAIGQPKTVPAGKYAMQVLTRFGSMGKQRLIYGTNVRQVLDYVERGEVTAGIVYQTDAMVRAHKVRVVAKADRIVA